MVGSKCLSGRSAPASPESRPLPTSAHGSSRPYGAHLVPCTAEDVGGLADEDVRWERLRKGGRVCTSGLDPGGKMRFQGWWLYALVAAAISCTPMGSAPVEGEEREGPSAGADGGVDHAAAPPSPPPFEPGRWRASEPLVPAEDWPNQQGSWTIDEVSLAVSGDSALVTATIFQIVTPDETAAFAQSWVLKPDGWVALGAPAPDGMVGTTQQRNAWSSDGSPLRATRRADSRIQVERWEDGTWTPIGAPIGFAHPPMCVALHPQGDELVIVWSEHGSDARDQNIYFTRLNTATGVLDLPAAPLSSRGAQRMESCHHVELDSTGNPVILWEEVEHDDGEIVNDELRVAHWDESNRDWRELPVVESGWGELWGPRLSLGAGDVPTVIWWGRVSRHPWYPKSWKTRQYDPVSRSWEDVRVPLPEVTDASTSGEGHPILCFGLYCLAGRGGEWTSVADPALRGEAVEHTLTRNHSGALFVLGREGPPSGYPHDPERAKPTLRLYRLEH